MKGAMVGGKHTAAVAAAAAATRKSL